MIRDPVLVDDWHPVMRSDAVQVGKAYPARLLGEDIVLWRSGSQVLAWQDLCIHRGTRLSLGSVQAESLACPYHGWEYDTHGHCVHIPAHPEQTPPTKARVQTYSVCERYGLVWVSLGSPKLDVPTFNELSAPGYQQLLTGPMATVAASATRILENFLDIAHFPFVHQGTLGDPARPEIPDYHVEATAQGISARDVVIYQPDPYGAGSGATVCYTYHVLRPFTAYLTKTGQDGAHFSLMLMLTPHDERSTTAWFYSASNESIHVGQDEFQEYQVKIFAQDVPIVASQRPELLPLDLQAELHLRSDRLAVAYRRWLKELGLTYGTS